jgi:pimeloyl-ACP methyl ester carboxylesterase
MHGQINRLSPRCLIFFHGNAEDVGDMMPMLRKLRDGLQTNIIAVEYPGYGLTYGRREPTP